MGMETEKIFLFQSWNIFFPDLILKPILQFFVLFCILILLRQSFMENGNFLTIFETKPHQMHTTLLVQVVSWQEIQTFFIP